jgi:hypothetical protein
MAASNVFFLRAARELDVERDVLMALPQENQKAVGGQFFRVPVRSSFHGGGAALRYIPNSRHVVESAAGLKRLLLRFPESFCAGVRSYDGDAALTLGFPLFNQRDGPSDDERSVVDRLDRAARFIAESGPPPFPTPPPPLPPPSPDIAPTVRRARPRRSSGATGCAPPCGYRRRPPTPTPSRPWRRICGCASSARRPGRRGRATAT